MYLFEPWWMKGYNRSGGHLQGGSREFVVLCQVWWMGHTSVHRKPRLTHRIKSLDHPYSMQKMLLFLSLPFVFAWNTTCVHCLSKSAHISITVTILQEFQENVMMKWILIVLFQNSITIFKNQKKGRYRVVLDSI